jgi:predicted lipoprotein with Yx(FWY)xxD motif
MGAMNMRITGIRAGMAAATVVAAAGVIVAVAVMPGSAQSGSPAAAVRDKPRPVPSITVPAGVPTNVPATATPPTLTLEVATSARYGPILVTTAGITVYRPVGKVTNEKGYSPLLAPTGQQLRLPILVPGKLSTVVLPGGKRQLTFNGAPLYLYAGDHHQGDTNGTNMHWRVTVTDP